LVALHCVVNVLEAHPPTSDSSYAALADRVYELASKFLDRDLLIAGEKAAIGESATHALAALGDQRLSECITKINSLDLPWLVRRVRRKLEATLNSWRETAEGVPAPVVFVRQQLDALSK
jgi:hypothetical protein